MAAAGEEKTPKERVRELRFAIHDKKMELDRSLVAQQYNELQVQLQQALVDELMSHCKLVKHDVPVARAIFQELAPIGRRLTASKLAKRVERNHKIELDGTTGRTHVISVMLGMAPYVQRMGYSDLSRKAEWCPNVNIEQAVALINTK